MKKDINYGDCWTYPIPKIDAMFNELSEQISDIDNTSTELSEQISDIEDTCTELSEQISGLIKSESITGTTDTYGNIKLTSANPKNIVLCCQNDQDVFIPFRYRSEWYARVQNHDASGAPQKSVEVTCTVYYV